MAVTVDQYKIALEVTGEQAVAGATNALKTLGGVIAGFSIGAFASSVLTLADNMSDLGNAVGLTMGQVTGFSLAVQQAGGNFDDAGKGIVKFYRGIEDAATGSDKAQASLAKIGIGLNDIKTKSEGQLLTQALDGLAKMEAGAQRTAIQMELFGKSFANVDPSALAEMLKSMDIEEVAGGLEKVKEANDKMSAAMFRFKVAAAEALAPLMPILDGIISVLSVVAKHLDVLGVAMGAVFGAAMIANIGRMTTAMRMFAASNPFTLIAMAVGTVVVAIAELIDKYGSFGNAMKAVGNMAINAVNMMINAYKAFGIFIGNLMVGVGKAILAGLNPFSNKSAMGELQAGFQKGLAAAQNQMKAAGPIKFKFDVEPVVKKKGTSVFDSLAQGTGRGAMPNATGTSDKASKNAQDTAKAMREQAMAAKQTTDELIAQNAASNEMRQLEISLIGVATERASLIRANAQAEATAKKEVAELQAKINEEQAKGKDANKEVIAELQKQVAEKQKQVGVSKVLNQQEYERTMELKRQKSLLENMQAIEDQNAKFKLESDKQSLRHDVITGQLSEEQFNTAMQMAQMKRDYELQSEKILNRVRVSNDANELNDLLEQLDLLNETNKQNKLNFAMAMAQQEAMKKSSAAGIRAAIEQAEQITTPFYMAQQSMTALFSSMNSAIDNFVTTGKFKFGDFARSVIADIAKIALKAAATKILGGIFGSLFLPSAAKIGASIPFGSTLKLAAGGPAKKDMPHIVGEQGPELFVPNSNGKILTNASLNKNAGAPAMQAQPVVNNTYITNNISAIDSRSVAQMFVENRKSLLGASLMARKEMPYGS